MFLLLCSAALAADGLSMGDFAVGEWSVVPKHGDRDSGVFTAAVTYNERKKVHEATFWKDDVNSSEILPVSDFMAGHFEIEFLTDFAGQVYSMKPTRHLMSKFDFQPVGLDLSVQSRIKLDGGETLQLTFVNGTYFSAVVSRKGTTKTSEYLIVRMESLNGESGQSRLRFWMYIAGLALAIQVFLWLMLRACRSSLDSRFDQIRENMVIDLDEYGKEPKVKEE